MFTIVLNTSIFSSVTINLVVVRNSIVTNDIQYNKVINHLININAQGDSLAFIMT